ncbi:hypothetical protein D3C87_1917220 [compost metagenome]
MSGITNQQDAAGELGDCNHLAHNAFVTNDRLAFVNTVHAAFVDNHLIAVRIVDGGDHLSHHFLLVLTQR